MNLFCKNDYRSLFIANLHLLENILTLLIWKNSLA